MKVYLAGPIAGMNDMETHQWREIVSLLLHQEGIETIDPAQIRDFRGVPYPGDIAVVEPDKADIDSAHVLLANCHAVSVGTSMEILYAWERGKFVVVRHPDPAHASPWIHYHAHVVVASLGGALTAIAEWAKDPTAWTDHDLETRDYRSGPGAWSTTGQFAKSNRTELNSLVARDDDSVLGLPS